MKKYRVGIIGLRMGNRWAKGAFDLPDTELIIVYDKNPELTRKKSEEYHTSAAKSEEEFFHADLDIAIVATPDHLHVPQSIAALEKGMHVICEKPLAGNVEQCRKLIAAVEASGRFFMVGQVCRYAPGFRTAKQLVESGEIGEIFYIESEYAHDYTIVPGVDNWRKDPAIGREHIVGGGCHALDLVRWIAGNPREVFCYTNHKILTDWPTSDTGVMVMKWENSVIGRVFVSSAIKSKYTMRTVIHGSKGSIICDNTSPTVKFYSSRLAADSKSHDFIEIPVKLDSHNVTAELDEFIRYLKRGEQCPTDVYEGTRTVALAEAALLSATTGIPVKLEDVFN
jgi:UDP-N-acetylglucosamine 3-dehydrogenase